MMIQAELFSVTPKGQFAESDRPFGDNDIIIPPAADNTRNTMLRILGLSPIRNAGEQHAEILELNPGSLPSVLSGDTGYLVLSGSAAASLSLIGDKGSLELQRRGFRRVSAYLGGLLSKMPRLRCLRGRRSA